MFCCLTASTARALLCMADVEFGIQVIDLVEAVVAFPEPRGRGHDALVSDLLTFVGLLKFSVRNSGVMSAS